MWRTYTIRNLATGSISQEYAPDLATAFALVRKATGTRADLECVTSVEGNATGDDYPAVSQLDMLQDRKANWAGGYPF